jgi:hypothetical protein
MRACRGSTALQARGSRRSWFSAAALRPTKTSILRVMPGLPKFAVGHPAEKRSPFSRRKDKDRTVPVLGISYRNISVDECDFDTAVRKAVRALRPLGSRQVHYHLLKMPDQRGADPERAEKCPAVAGRRQIIVIDLLSSARQPLPFITAENRPPRPQVRSSATPDHAADHRDRAPGLLDASASASSSSVLVARRTALPDPGATDAALEETCV